MAFEIPKLEWERKANEVSLRLPDDDPGRDARGRELVRVLTTFGAFFNELSDRRDFDAAVNAKRASSTAASPGAAAGVRIGGLVLTAKNVGSAGNSLVAVVTPGFGARYSQASVDAAASEKQKQATLAMLDGVVGFYSTDPVVADVQQQVADFLKSLPEDQKSQARQIIESTWDDPRVARTTIEPPHAASDLGNAISSMGLSSADAEYAISTDAAARAARESAAASIFTLVVSDGAAASEKFSEIPTGFPFPLLELAYQNDLEFLQNVPRDASETAIFETDAERSAAVQGLVDQRAALESSVFGKTSSLIAAPSWESLAPPPPGTYFFSGGLDAVLPNQDAAPPDESKYVYSVAGREFFSLAELREIVGEAIEQADDWLTG